MTFYLLTTGFSANTQERAALLQAACQQRGIACVALETSTADRLALPELRPGDALYNATRDGMRLEELLWRPGVATFYAGDQPPRGIQDTTRWLAAHTRAGLPQPRTIAHPTADRALLVRYVDYLGGFPLVVKVAGGTLGTGVMRADSWPALLSLVDYLVATGTEFMLREYLESTGSGRLMVIGDRVVGALEYDNLPTDFRTNAAGGPPPRLTRFAPAVEALAVAATQAVGAELAGVDVLLDQAGRAYLLEINLPCGFATFPKLGVDVPGMLVDYLTAKAKRLYGNVH
ncbi:MAG: ATP-grasp domain-containing protein [Janthinobacterium lividum]